MHEIVYLRIIGTAYNDFMCILGNELQTHSTKLNAQHFKFQMQITVTPTHASIEYGIPRGMLGRDIIRTIMQWLGSLIIICVNVIPYGQIPFRLLVRFKPHMVAS